MAFITLEIPDDLLCSVCDKARSDGLPVSDTAIALLGAGLNVSTHTSPAPSEAVRLVSLLVERAKNYPKNALFTTQHLVDESEWNSFHAASRKSAGKGFSKEVRDKNVGSVRYTGEKTVQNKSIYIRD